MHQPSRGLSSSKSQNLLGAKARTLSSFDGTTQYSSNPNPISYTHEKRLESRLRDLNNSDNQDNYDAPPSFGEETRFASTGGVRPAGKVGQSHDFQNENIVRLLKEAKAKPIEITRGNLNEDLSSRLRYDNQTSRSNQTSRDLKNSTAYLNAMRALQDKIKKMEDQLEFSRRDQGELERKHQKEIDGLVRRFDEERRSMMDLENNLKNRLGLLEEELKERERTIDSLGVENERIRRMAHDAEAEKVAEIQRLLNEKTRFKSEYRELEGKYEERGRLEEELRSRIIQVEYNVKEKENFSEELRDKIGVLEKEKIDMSYQFEQKLTELVTKLKQAEEKKRELEGDLQEDIKRRQLKDNETDRELTRLKLNVKDLETRNDQAEVRIKENESELIEKTAQIMTLKEEIQNLTKELERTKNANEKSNYYAQDMVKINQKLISSLSSKSRGNSQVPEDIGLHQSPHHTFSTQLPQGAEESFSVSRRHHPQNLPLQMPEYPRTEVKGAYKTPKSVEKRKIWSTASPNQRENLGREENSYYQGPQLTGDDLRTSDTFGRGLDRSQSKSGRNDKSAKKERENMEKLQHEMVIKEIIEVEKKTLDWNREYQRLTNEMIGMDRDSSEYKGKKRGLEDIANKLQELTSHLIHLKKKEEEITSNFRL